MSLFDVFLLSLYFFLAYARLQNCIQIKGKRPYHFISISSLEQVFKIVYKLNSIGHEKDLRSLTL